MYYLASQSPTTPKYNLIRLLWLFRTPEKCPDITTIQLFHTKLISPIPTNDWVKKLLFLQAGVDRILPGK